MLESVVAGVLNRVLSVYVDNLDTSQLNIGIWSGEILLRNLKLRKAALDKFNLPVEVVEGYIGELKLSVPWSNLSGKPVRVLIENVYLLAVPTSASGTVAEDEERSQAAKQEKLGNAEMMTTQSVGGMSIEEEAKNESFTASLITKIVDNLQIEVRNIHIRYEDNLSVPGHPFSAGITLSGFSAVSTDELWQPTFINNNLKGIHKLAKLESLAVYFDTDSESLAGYPIEEAITKFTNLIAKEGHTPEHQFILKPVSGEGRLVMNKKVDGSTPKTDAELLFKELGFVLDEDQYRDMLSMIDSFHFHIRQREYRPFRPTQALLEENRSKALWGFAIKAIKTEVHEKNRKLSWFYLAERRDDRKEYVRLFKLKCKKEVGVDDGIYLVELEKKLGYKDIRFYRSIARSELRKEQAAAKQVEEDHKPAAAGGGWLGWVGWAATPVETHHDSTVGLSEEQRKELYQAIDWDEKEAVASAIDFPKEAMMLRVKAKLETGSFALRTDPAGANKDLVSLNFDGFQLDLIQRPDNFEAELALGGLRVFDGTCEGSLHTQIVKVKDSKAAPITLPPRPYIPPEDREADDDEAHLEIITAEPILPQDPFFSMKFEQNPLDERADTALAVRLRHMEIIYHRGYVEAIFAFFKPPESQLESVGALIDVASSTLEGIRKETRAGLEYALAQHKTVDVQLDLNAPIIIIPENMTMQDCQHIVLDAGHISVVSKLADKSATNEVKAKEKQEYSDEDYVRLESLMYDKYFIKLDSAQLLMGPSLQACLDALEDDHNGHSDGGELHILERTSLTFLAQNCILAQAPNLTRFKVSGSLPALQLNISDRKYKGMMKMIDIAIPQFGQEVSTSRPAPSVMRKPSAFSRTKEYEDYHLDQEKIDDEEETGKDEFFDTEDINDNVNVHQKIFEFTFSVDRVQTSVFRSNLDPRKADRLLANAVLEGFHLEFGLRPFDMSVDVTLRSLYIEDRMVDEDNEFRHLVTSEKMNGDGGEGQDLVRIRYQGVQKDSPEFMTVHEGIDKTVDVELSTINMIITRGSILTLFDWVMTTFTDPGAPLPAPDPTLEDSESETEGGNDKLRVKVKLTSIVAVLNEDGFRLGTLSLSAADVSVMLRSPTMRVAARLGNLTFVDDFSSEGPKEMLSIQGDELADFQYETYDPDDALTYPGHDTLIYLRTGSLRFTFVEEPVHRLLSFFSKFARMKAFYDAAAEAAAQRATELQTRIQKMHYDILVRTPILVFPRETDQRDVIIANLGEISLTNSFEETEDQIITKVQAGLRSVRLSSTLHFEDQGYSLQILDDVNIEVEVTSTENSDISNITDVPASQIAAKMSDVKMNLTEAQYGFIISLSQTIPRAFTSADDEDDDYSLPASRSTPTPLPGSAQDETVDLLPELGMIAKRADGVEIQLRSSLELTFSVSTIYLELFTAAAVTAEALKSASLAKFSLNDTGVKYKMLSNGSMEAEVVVRSFTVHDTRAIRQTKFREIIPATSHDGHQFMINFTQSGGTDQSAFANVTIDSPKIIFSLDPLFALLDYFTSAFTEATDVIAAEVVDSSTAALPVEARTFAYRVNVVSPTIILLDDPERADSEAVILSISQIQMSQQGTLALTASKIGMFLCKMDKPKDTIRVLDNFDITLSMDSRADLGRQVTSIDIAIQPLVFRVSFHDIILINSIINRAIEMSNRGTVPVPPSAPLVISNKASVVRKPSQTSTNNASPGARRLSVGNRELKAQVIMSKETLRATVDGFQMILIGDAHDLPMLDIKAGKFTTKVNDWSTDLKASIGIMPFINYFNLSVSHWEPLMDPWEFTVHVSRSQLSGLLAITLSSQKRLELNITATFIGLALTTMALMNRAGDKAFTSSRGVNAPFLIKNRTGYPLSIWSETSEDPIKSATERLEDGADIPWRFDDWRTMRENVLATSHNALTLHFDGMTWDRLKHVSVDREGEHIYALRPKLDSVTHRLLCEVKLVDNVKVVTFRSTFQVENRSLVTAEMVIVDANGKRASNIYKIPPGADCPVPIIAAWNSRIKIRPDPGFGYAWSTESFGWQDLIKRPTRGIVCKSQKEVAFRFQAYTVHDKSDPLIRIYPRISLRLRAPIEVQNLLPYDIRYRVFDKNLEHNWTNFLRKDGVSPIHVAELSHLLLLSVELQDSAFQRSEFAVINTDNPEDIPVERDLVVADKEGLKLNLRIHYQLHAESGGAFRVQVYTPYLLINKTGCNFSLKTKTFLSSAKIVAGQQALNGNEDSEPFMFSFANEDRRNRVLLRINDSAWSKPLSFETVGVETEVIMPSASGNEEIHIGLKVTEGLGDYKLTKVITIYPRFIVKNDLGEAIRFRELGSKESVIVPSGERYSLEFLRAGHEPRLVLSYPTGTTWSAPFKLQDVGKTHVRVQRDIQDEDLISIDVILEGPCIFIRLEPERGSWPFLLRNDSDYKISVCQADEADFKSTQRPPVRKYLLDPHEKMQYAWDLPAYGNKQLRITVNGVERLVNVLEIGSQIPFRFPAGSHSRVMSIDVRAEGPTQAIRFSNYAEDNSVFKIQRRTSEPLSRQASSAGGSREGTFEAVTVEAITTFSFGISLEGIGISLVTKKMQELIYASFRGVTAKYSDSTTSVSYDLGVKWIQVDNQLFGGLYPILLYPSVIPKDGKELEVHPSFQASVIVLKDEAHGVTYFKYASVLIQEMTIEVDEDFLFALLDFSKFEGASGQDEIISKLTDEPKGIPEPTGTSSGGDVYFEVLHLQPIQLDLSFMRTDRVNVDQKSNTRNPVFFLVNALTMALGNVNDAPVRLNALVIENVRLSLPVLQERLLLHYSQEFKSQIYRVLGSADFLGNPIGLFTNVSSGVQDFFVQPYDSVMLNGSKDLGIGIARGAGSLAKKTIFGFSDGLTKITGSIGKGLSAATLDKDYQNQRRMRQFRNRPKHALYGVTAGATSLVTSLVSGFEGVVMMPIQGAESGGAAGFLKGFGKGLVGVVTKPAVGLFDLANNVTEGIRNTTTVFDQTSIDRVRLPRFTASDGILRPYQDREALGQNWLKNVETGKYFSETYVAHLEIPSSDDSLCVLLTTSRILLIKVLKLKIGWDVPFSDLKTISLEGSGITLVLRGGIPGPYLPIPEQSARLWLFRNIERVVVAYNGRKSADG